jgi:para-nitrobenzyl esterase
MAIVDTRTGKIEGFEKDGVQVFLGVPYAEPPVGPLRWQAPRVERSWEGVRTATEFSAQSAQSPFALNAIMGGGRPAYSEDSLYLNVWTPACDDAKRPVMFWIHGGAFIWGAGDTPWYDGAQFCNNGDVVLVTINYRLGPFGYLHLDELFPDSFSGSGNCGPLDQIAALEWVRDCIAGFGGDPNNVTIFGESAGAGSVSSLLGAPAARGLFHKAIAESGSAAWVATTDRATEVATQVVTNLGASGDLDKLLAATTDEIIAAVPPFVENGSNALPFQPVFDNVVFPEPPLTAIANGNAAGVHFMSGTNANEMTLFTMADAELATIDDERVRQRVINALGDDRVFQHYRARYPDMIASELWTQIATDAIFRVPSIHQLEAQRAHGPVWSYLFTWTTPVFGGMLKSTHALEIPFVFDNLAKGAELFTGTGEERQALADAMHRAWIAFARTGNPNHPGIPEWPEYDETRRATMHFDVPSAVHDDPAAEDRAAFDHLFR